MMQVEIYLEPVVARFYMLVAQNCGVSIERVISDALFKLAAELSLEALHNIQKS